MTESVHRLLAALRQDGASQVALVHGDLVLAEPAAREVADALAARHGGRVEAHRRPPGLGPLLQDLRTFSMFGSAKALLAIDTFVFADRSAAADLVDEAEEALPLAGGAGPAAALSVRDRQAASRLLQALKDQGFYYGEITGEKNADTTAAIRRYQIRNGLQITGDLNDETMRSLKSGAGSTSASTPAAPGAMRRSACGASSQG